MITKIVITGGPCGGKSSAMPIIKNEFETLGYKVLTIHETATELISSGIEIDECGVYDFQKNLLLLQLEKERCVEMIAKSLEKRHEKILIVCDRGAMDGMSYLSREDFAKIKAECGLSTVDIRDKYDGVFHLVTAANGAERYYTLSNNSARKESIKEAKKCDEDLISVWCGHPHLRIIDNSTNFEGKVNRLITEIKHLLGEPEPLEIERKYLIEYPDIKYLDSLKNCHKIEIEQIYCTKNNKNFRLRKRGESGEYVYFKTEKTQLSKTKRIEIESRISKEEYKENDAYINGKIVKDRYCLVYGNKYFEIDVFPSWNDKALMEIELTDENEKYSLPDFIEVIEDVTGNTNYNNSTLALNNK